MASPPPPSHGLGGQGPLAGLLGGTAAGEDAERAVAAGVAAVAPDNLGAKRLAPLAASEGAGEAAERMARKRALAERFAKVIQFSFGVCFVIHIVTIVYQR